MEVRTLSGRGAKGPLDRAMLLALFVGLLSLGICPAAVLGGERGRCRSPVIPPRSCFAQKVYEHLALEWWQWLIEIPAAVNPVADETGEHAAEGQSGLVWFLAGNFGGETTRVVTVPRGKFLFFPIITYGGWAPTDGETEEEVRATCNWAVDHVTVVECTIDGEPVEDLWSYRFESPVGSFGPNDMTDEAAAAGSDILIADGYWLLLRPLPPGEHVIEFHGVMPFPEWNWTFELTVTYYLTVEGRRGCRRR